MLPPSQLKAMPSPYMNYAPAPGSDGSDFEVEHQSPRSSPRSQRTLARRSPTEPAVDYEQRLQSAVDTLVLAKARPFSVSGRIPLDLSIFNLFFRTPTGVAHSLSFPINVDEDTPPALEVLLSTCDQRPSPLYSPPTDLDALIFSRELPLCATIDLSSHPVLDAIRATLLPTLPAGQYLTTAGDHLQLVPAGARMAPLAAPADGRAATLLVTLPVRFRGGASVVRAADGRKDVFPGSGGRGAELAWVALLGECEYEVEPVRRGCRVAMSYAVHVRSYGPSGMQPSPLIAPSDSLLDALAPVLHMSRGRRVGFYLANDYAVDPSEMLADSIVPHLKGADTVLYHAMKMFNLVPELRWTAGGYVWGVDRTVECGVGGVTRNLRASVEGSGAVTLMEANIAIMASGSPGQVGKAKVPFVGANGELEKLIVNVLLVVLVP